MLTQHLIGDGERGHDRYAIGADHFASVANLLHAGVQECGAVDEIIRFLDTILARHAGASASAERWLP